MACFGFHGCLVVEKEMHIGTRNEGSSPAVGMIERPCGATSAMTFTWVVYKVSFFSVGFGLFCCYNNFAFISFIFYYFAPSLSPSLHVSFSLTVGMDEVIPPCCTRPGASTTIQVACYTDELVDGVEITQLSYNLSIHKCNLEFNFKIHELFSFIYIM